MKRRNIAALCFGADEYPISWDADAVENIRQELEDDEDNVGTSRASAGIDFMARSVVMDPETLKNPRTALACVFHEGAHIVDVSLGMDLEEKQVVAMGFAWMSLLIQSGMIDPDEYAIAGVPLTKCRQARASADET